ncbi:hypothetical protein FS837_009898 [Tulasnella sp. UAMH 9824]|nr:hypothetical protein FS837_009898 [Tulasnella sp. UAMH 9824]
MTIILGDPWIFLHFKKHIKHTGGYSGSLKGTGNRPCQLLELRKTRPGVQTPFVWYNISDAAHQVVGRIDRVAHEAYLQSGNHPSRKPLVLLQAFKSEWCQGSTPDDDPIPVITITDLGHLSTQEDTLGQPKILSHTLYSWWETYKKSKKTEDTNSSLVPGRAVTAGNNLSPNVPAPPIAEPSNVPAIKRTLLDRWPGLILSEEACSISEGDKQILDKIGFAASLKGPELSRPEETTEEPSADVSISSKSDDNLDWSASPSPERTGKQSDDDEDIQVKEEDDDEVLQQLGEGGESTTAQVHAMEETPAEVIRPEYPTQLLRKEAGVTIFKPAILIPDSDTSMTQSSHSQSLSQTRHLHHLTAPNSSIEHPPSSHHSSVPPRNQRATQPPASMPPPLDKIASSSKEAFRSSTPLGHLSSSPSNVEDDDTSPDGKSTLSKARGPKLKSRPSWARAMTNEEVMRRISTPLRDPNLGPSTDSSPVLAGLPSASSDASDQWHAQDIKTEQQSQALGLPSPSPRANVLTVSRNTNVQETSKVPRVLGARTTAQRTTTQKYQDLADVLSGVLRENGREG